MSSSTDPKSWTSFVAVSPHPRHPEDVVRRVALERDVVEVLLGWEAEAFRDRLDVVAADVRDALDVEHHREPGPDELEEVAVGGDDHHLDPLVQGPERERGDRVVRLVSSMPITGMRSVSSTSTINPSLPKLVRRLGPPGLVLGVLLKSRGRLAHVERHRDQVRLLLRAA